MGLKAALSKPFAAFIVKGVTRWKKDAVAAQKETFHQLIDAAKDTAF